MSSKTEKLLVFSAPSGSGKTTIVQHLLSTFSDRLAFSISATTRAPRGSEEHGKEYYFLSEQEFKQRVEQNEFLEYEEVYPGLFYGTLKSELHRIWSKGKAVVFDIDVVGGLNIKRAYPEQTRTFFVKPPSLDELKRRLQTRGTDSEEVLSVRLNKANIELSRAEEFDQIIINNDLEQALKQAEHLAVTFLES